MVYKFTLKELYQLNYLSHSSPHCDDFHCFDHVFVFSFSQGALVCYELLKILDKPIAGMFPISGFIADQNKDIERIHPAQINTPVVIGHGLNDDVVLFNESELAVKLLKNESNNVILEPYQGGHKIGYSYIKKIKDLIEQIH